MAAKDFLTSKYQAKISINAVSDCIAFSLMIPAKQGLKPCL